MALCLFGHEFCVKEENKSENVPKHLEMIIN